MTRNDQPDTASGAEKGAVAIIVALLLVPMTLLAAFTVDLGITYAQAQAFSAGADSAALAIVGAKRADLNAHPTTPVNCQSLITNDAGKSLAIAKKQTDANRPYDLKATTGEVGVQVSLTCTDKNGAPNANGIFRVRVTVQRDVPTSLGRVAGVNSIRASREASGGLGVLQGVTGGGFPLTICDAVAEDIMSRAGTAPYPIETINPNKVWKGECKAPNKDGSGNWGWLDCDGNGTPALVDAILNGCDVDLTLTGNPPSVTVDGMPGNKINAGPVRDALDTVRGTTFPFPVYDKMTGNGTGTDYRIVGFINMKFVDYDGNGDIRVQYVSYSPVGQINPSCGIGGACATFNNYGIGLGS